VLKEKKQEDQSKLMRVFSRWLLKFIGWSVEGQVPSEPQYVLLGYPHTSNWDVPLGKLIFSVLGVRLHWVGKHTLFKKPQVWITKPLGGIPLNRDQTKNFVQAVVDVFKSTDELVLTVSPEGTRTKTDFWRTGFYYIALGAKVPIALGFLDYKNKRGGFGPVIHPSGNLEADLEIIKEFYADKYGKNPEEMGTIRPRPE